MLGVLSLRYFTDNKVRNLNFVEMIGLKINIFERNI